MNILSCDRPSRLAWRAFSYDQVLRLAYRCDVDGVGRVGEQVSTNPKSHVARTADQIIIFCQTHRRSDDQALRAIIRYLKL